MARLEPWFVVFGGFLCNSFLLGFLRTIGVFYGHFIHFTKSSGTAVATVIAVQNGLRCLIAPIASIIFRKIGARFTAIIGGLMFSGGIMGCVVFPNISYLFFTFGLLSGFGGALIFAIPYITINEVFYGTRWHSLAMSLATSGVGVGVMAFGTLNNFLLEQYTFKSAIFVVGAIMLNICVGGMMLSCAEPQPKDKETEYLVDPNTKSYQGTDNTRSSDGPQTSTGRNRTIENQEIILSKNQSNDARGFWYKLYSYFTICTLGLAVYTVCTILQSSVLMSNLIFIGKLAKQRHLPPEATFVLLTVIGASDIIGRILIGFLFDLPFARDRKSLCLAINGIFLGITTTLTGVATTYSGIITCTAVYALFAGGYHAQSIAVICEFVPKDMNHKATGIIIFFTGIGQLTSPIWQSALSEKFHSYTFIYIFSGSLFSGVCFISALQYLVEKVLTQNKTILK